MRRKKQAISSTLFFISYSATNNLFLTPNRAASFATLLISLNILVCVCVCVQRQGFHVLLVFAFLTPRFLIFIHIIILYRIHSLTCSIFFLFPILLNFLFFVNTRIKWKILKLFTHTLFRILYLHFYNIFYIHVVLYQFL